LRIAPQLGRERGDQFAEATGQDQNASLCSKPIPVAQSALALISPDWPPRLLVALAISHRTIGWFRAQGVDWSRAIVLITGQQGRPTAGVTWTTNSVAQLIPISGPDDMLAMTTRLRVVIEDPRQLLSGCVTDYAAQQLMAVNNDPAQVIVPGLDNRTYPRRD
jgi:hypothetical protein